MAYAENFHGVGFIQWHRVAIEFEFEFEFIDKQPMKAGQGLKSSLATQKHRKKKKMTHIHTNETVKTENEFILKGCISGQKQTRLSKQAQ